MTIEGGQWSHVDYSTDVGSGDTTTPILVLRDWATDTNMGHDRQHDRRLHAAWRQMQPSLVLPSSLMHLQTTSTSSTTYIPLLTLLPPRQAMWLVITLSSLVQLEYVKSDLSVAQALSIRAVPPPSQCESDDRKGVYSSILSVITIWTSPLPLHRH